jgi:hypothetical protein
VSSSAISISLPSFGPTKEFFGRSTSIARRANQLNAQEVRLAWVQLGCWARHSKTQWFPSSKFTYSGPTRANDLAELSLRASEGGPHIASGTLNRPAKPFRGRKSEISDSETWTVSAWMFTYAHEFPPVHSVSRRITAT